MRKITIAIWILFVFAAVRMYALDAPVATIGTVSSYGTTATVPITATNFTDIGGWSLRVSYDPAIVSVSSVTLGSGLEGGGLDVNLLTSGQIRLSWYTSPGLTLTGEPVVVNINFNKVTSGTSALAFLDNGYSCAWYDGTATLMNDLPFENFYHAGAVSFISLPAPVTTAPDLFACPGSVVHVPVTVGDFTNIGSL